MHDRGLRHMGHHGRAASPDHFGSNLPMVLALACAPFRDRLSMRPSLLAERLTCLCQTLNTSNVSFVGEQPSVGGLLITDLLGALFAAGSFVSSVPGSCHAR